MNGINGWMARFAHGCSCSTVEDEIKQAESERKSQRIARLKRMDVLVTSRVCVGFVVATGEGAVVVTVTPRHRAYEKSDVPLRTAPEMHHIAGPTVSPAQYQSNLDRLYVNPLKLARFI
jgi:uncharacterized protein YlxW (UPF0749 family)